MTFGQFPNDPGLGTQFLIAQAAAGAPTTGYWTQGSAIIDANGIVWACTATGTPGTWEEGASGGGAVASVFGRTGAVVAANGDYTVGQVTGAAPLASPALTGVPTAPTPAMADNSTTLATTAYVKGQPVPSALLASLTASAPIVAGQENIILQAVVPAGGFAVGAAYRAVLILDWLSATGSRNVNLRLGTTGTTADTAIVTVGNNFLVSTDSYGEFWFTIRTIGAAGTVIGGGQVTDAGNNPSIALGASSAVNTTVNNTISLTIVIPTSGNATIPLAFIELA